MRQVFHFRAGKSAVTAVLLLGFAALCGWMWFNGAKTLFGLVGLLCLLGAGKILADVVQGTPALVITPQGVSVRRTWGGLVHVDWEDVHAIDLDVLTIRYWGIIPISKQESLVIRCEGGLFGTRRLRLALQMVQLPPGGGPHLLLLLQTAHVAAVGEAGVAMAGAGEHGWGIRSVPQLSRPRRSVVEEDEGSSFDADAALARYMAQRTGTAARMPEAAARTPGAAAQPAAAPAVPARPTFGRKSSAG